MVGANVSFVVLGGRAALVIDVPGEGHTGALDADDDPVVWSFTTRGLRLLPGFLGSQLPETDGLVCVLGHGQVALTTPEEVDVLEAPLDALSDTWIDAADRHAGVLLFVGRDVGVEGLDAEQAVGEAIDRAARAGRVLGAAVDLD